MQGKLRTEICHNKKTVLQSVMASVEQRLDRVKEDLDVYEKTVENFKD